MTPSALLVTLVRRDGVTLGFTDHDAPLVVDERPYAPAPIRITDGAETFSTLDEAPLLAGMLDAAGLRADDLDAGLWDGAAVHVERVDPAAPSRRVVVTIGRLGVVRRGDGVFEAEVQGPKAALAIPVGRVFARTCDADLGDARCGVDLNAAAFRGAGTVVEIVSPRSIRATGFDAYADGWFTGGSIIWGARRATVVAHRADGARAAFDLDAAPPQGARIVATVGCDKAFATCRARFANAVNFRGFPHMIGPDALIRSADADGVADGGARR